MKTEIIFDQYRDHTPLNRSKEHNHITSKARSCIRGES